MQDNLINFRISGIELYCQYLVHFVDLTITSTSYFFFINNWIVLFVDLTVTYMSEYLYRQLDCVDNTYLSRDHRVHDRTLVGFTITCAISAYPH